MAIFASCEVLDTKVDTLHTQEDLDTNYGNIITLGYSPYSYIDNGFSRFDWNIPAARTDEAEYTASSSNVQSFNDGSWSAYNNPDDVYSRMYLGIRAANHFLEYTVNYREQLANNRDTLSDYAREYNRDVEDVEYLRAEAHVLRAYYYFELIKRYGGVPLVKTKLGIDDNADFPRESYDNIVQYAVEEIDYALDSLQANWKVKDIGRDGRFSKGSALALKARILLYAASPLNNASNDIEKWKRAAQAAHDVISLGQYSLSNNYRSLFLETASLTDNEIILSYRSGAINDWEKANYPIGTPGGNSGVTPSHNLVSAYEYKGTPDPNNPYMNRDPRLLLTVVTNNSSWNGRTIQTYLGGQDSYTNANTSRTGYYLKKFLIENLTLNRDETRIHNWVMFRYAEVLLNYAEAMNEAYGPDNDNGYGLSARRAVNMIRGRNGIAMPDVVAGNKDEMRDRIKHERRIELALEDHRYWDLIRWKDAETVLNLPIKGIRATHLSDNQFSYEEFTVEPRKFEAPKMYLYPIPQTEISKSNGILKQNPGW